MSDQSIYLPVGIDRISIINPLTNGDERLLVYAKLASSAEQNGHDHPTAELIKGTLVLLDMQQRVLLEVQGLHIQQLENRSQWYQSGLHASWLYTLNWQLFENKNPDSSLSLSTSKKDGAWIIFANTEVAKELCAPLMEQGQRVILVEAAEVYEQISPLHFRLPVQQREDFLRLLRAACPSHLPACRGILYAWSLSLPPLAASDSLDPTSEPEWLALAHTAPLPLLCLLQALTTIGWRDLPRLWVLTPHCLPDPDQPFAPGLPASPLWGLLRTAMQEHPALRISGVDLPTSPTASILQQLGLLLLADSREDQWLLRDHACYVARLQSLRLPAPAHPFDQQPPLLHPDACYVVTGAWGGLGLALCSWLVEHGATRLLLLGRTPPDPQESPLLAHWRSGGVQILTPSVDVGHAPALQQALEEARQTLGPIRGVFHLAGVLDDSTLLNLEPASWQRVQHPKIRGSWLLHHLTAHDPLDHFVLFSSAASLLGSAGQGNYAAANAFLDALAWLRRAQGRCGLSLNWGPWSQVGLAAAQQQRGPRLEQRGISSLSPQQGLDLLEVVLRAGSDLAQVGVWPFNLRQWRQSHLALADSPLFQTWLHDEEEEEASLHTHQVAQSLRQRLQEMESGQERQRFLETYLQEQFAQVLDIALSRIDKHTHFSMLGLDSLIAIELRNRFEASLGLTFPVTLL